MKFIKKLIEKLRGKKEKKEDSWYNNSEDKKKSNWHPTEDGAYYDENYHDMAVTNQIAKR